MKNLNRNGAISRLIESYEKQIKELQTENAELLTTIMQQDKELLALEEAKETLKAENDGLKARLGKGG